MSPANPGLRIVVFVVYIVAGVAGGQVGAWVAGAIAAFANLTGMVAALLGEGFAAGATFLIGSAAYAFVVGAVTPYAVGALAGKEIIDDPEALTGLVVGVAAFLLVTLLAEPYVRAVSDALPGVATMLTEASGFVAFAAAVLLHAVPIGLLAPLSWLVIRRRLRSSTDTQA